MTNNSIIDDLSKVEEGDIIQIVNATTSKVIRVSSIDKLGKDEDWFINGSVNGGGGEASFSKLYFENMLFDGYEIKIIKKTQPKLDQLSLGVDFEINRIVEVKELQESLGEPKNEVWLLEPTDVAADYSQERRNFFVVADIVNFFKKNDSNTFIKAKITQIDDENNIIRFYNLDEDNYGSFAIELFDTWNVEILEYYNLKDEFKNKKLPQVNQKVFAVDINDDIIVGVVELSIYNSNIEDEIWILKLKNNRTYSQFRKDFFVVGDVVKFSTKKDENVFIIGGITEIDVENKVVKFYNNEESNYGEFDLDNLFYWNIEIIQFVQLIKTFSNNDTTPQPQPIPQTQSIDFDAIIEDTKKEIGQLVFLRSLQSPLDFEENIKINQLISEKQKQLDKLIFQKTEMAISQDNVFDDLFEQSFTPIQNTYNNIFVKDEGSSDFFTPNGSRSLFNDAQNSLIRTPLFLDWFGDWQLAYQYKEAGIVDFPCSKVISSNYEPQVVWHGTGAEFSYFRFDNFPAAYFAVNQSYSQWFADLHSRGGDGFTIPFFLNVRNPLDLTMFETKKIDPKTFFDYMFLQTGLTKSELDINPIFDDPKLDPIETWVYLRNNPKMLKKLADTKIFDGIHFYETNPGVDQSEPFYKTEAWIIFDPQQAKLADPSRGVLLFSSLKSFLLKKGGKI